MQTRNVPSDEGESSSTAGHPVPRGSVVWPAAFVLAVLGALSVPALAQGKLPEGIPNVFDAQISADYEPYHVGNLEVCVLSSLL